MRAIRLKTEHLTAPMGVDFTAPQLFWNCEGGVQADCVADSSCR